MTDPTNSALTETMRLTLMGLADQIFPKANDMPSASEAQVHSGGVDRVLAVRPDLQAPLARLLSEAEGEGAAAEVARMRADDRFGFGVLALVVAGAYYLHDEVRKALKYPGQIPVLTIDDAPLKEQDPLLRPVLERGPIFRKAPV